MKKAKRVSLDGFEKTPKNKLEMAKDDLELYFLTRQKIILEARENFYIYCQALLPEFYTPDRVFLKKLCDIMQKFYEGSLYNEKGELATILLLNIPPRHGKTLTAGFFVSWCLGKNHEERFISCSYNEKLSTRFSKKIRNDIDAINLDKKRITVNDVFPDMQLKQGDSSATVWSLEDSFFSYLATSPTATMTGMGCSFGVVDDIIKDRKEAYNKDIKDEHWEWYKDTFLSRIENGGRQLIVMTRWAEDDLCGRILSSEAEGVYLVKFPAYNKITHKMLCPSILSLRGFEGKKKLISDDIIRANYQQSPRNRTTALYEDFQTYTEIPNATKYTLKNCTDTAEKGKDYFCSISYMEIGDMAYVLDVIYTQQNQDVTEKLYFESLIKNQVKTSFVESNNGGEGFRRNIDKLRKERAEKVNNKIQQIMANKDIPEEDRKELIEELNKKQFRALIETFYQTGNKESRIFSNAWNVVKQVIMPVNWKQKWPKFAEDVLDYSKIGKNLHDDAPDCLTMIIEKMQTVVVQFRSLN